MTMMSQTAAQVAIPTATGGSIRRAGIWVHALVAYWHRRAAIKTLRELDDRALRDIGLARCRIEAAVQGFADPDIARF
jgi:uncharacterized protein YjiS (DUF1127 family)